MPAPECTVSTELRQAYEFLAGQLVALEGVLHRFFPATSADDGLDAAVQAGLRHIERLGAIASCDLRNGAKWLRIVAFYAACRHLRQQPKTIPIEESLVAPACDGEARPVADTAPLRAAVASRPDRQRTAVTLVYLDGLTLAAASRKMGIRRQSVKSHPDAAVPRLRTLLANR